MLKGAAKLAPLAVKQDQCKPVTVQMMTLIKASLNQADPFDLAFFTCLMTISYMVARVGEFTIQRLDLFNPTEHITQDGMHDDTNHNGLHTKVFSLPCTKSSPSGEEVHWSRQDGPMDPSDAPDKHLSINNPPANSPLSLTKQSQVTKP